MSEFEYFQKAKELQIHLEVLDARNKLDNTLQMELFELEKIQNEIAHLSKKYDELQVKITQAKKDFDVYNLSYSLREASTDLNTIKKLRMDTWEELYECGKEKDQVKSEIQEISSRKALISQEVVTLECKLRSSQEFLRKFSQKIDVYSVVELNFKFETMKLMLVSEPQRAIHIPDTENVMLVSVETPIGEACLDRKPGEVLTYQAPNGLQVHGQVTSCRPPSLELITSVVSYVEASKYARIPDPLKLDLTGWTSNNSRYRKGG